MAPMDDVYARGRGGRGGGGFSRGGGTRGGGASPRISLTTTTMEGAGMAAAGTAVDTMFHPVGVGQRWQRGW